MHCHALKLQACQDTAFLTANAFLALNPTQCVVFLNSIFTELQEATNHVSLRGKLFPLKSFKNYQQVKKS